MQEAKALQGVQLHDIVIPKQKVAAAVAVAAAQAGENKLGNWSLKKEEIMIGAYPANTFDDDHS